MLAIVDEFTRECLAIEVARRLESEDLLERLADRFVRRGKPDFIRSDNAAEFTANAVRAWLARLGVQTLYIEPGSPWENGYDRPASGDSRIEDMGHCRPCSRPHLPARVIGATILELGHYRAGYNRGGMMDGLEVLDAGGKPIRMWLPKGHPVEEGARQQLGRVSRLPFVTDVACMPDVHVGLGATIGSVVGTERAIIPAAVGVDIGCGMMALELDTDASKLPDNLKGVRSAIEASVPHGRTNHGQEGDRGAWGDVPSDISRVWQMLSDRYEAIVKKHPKAHHKRALHHMGTLGTGNHFIEVCLDERERVWIMLHSGSRGVGNRIGSYFIDLAKEDMKIHHITVEDRDLSYLSEGTAWFDDYVEAVLWAQDYARANREVMMEKILIGLGRLASAKKFPKVKALSQAVNCHHNYVEREHHRGRNIWVTRKGAVRARAGDLGIIPGSMGANSFIVRGKGNALSLNSCSHGAGRMMSRKKARHTFTVEDHAKATEGIECRKDADVIDETPGAYKDIDAVIEVQRRHGMIEVVHTLRQVVCVKG